MKKILLSMVLIATTITSFAQGKVSFANDSSRLFEFGNIRLPGDVAGPIPTSPTPSGTTLIAVLYAGTTSSSLALQTSIPITGTSWLAAGRMATKTVVLTIPGAVAQNFDIVLVNQGATLPATIDGNLATRLADANTMPSTQLGQFAGATYYGASGLFTMVPGTSITYPFIYGTTSPSNSTWQQGSVFINTVPEPSSLALAGLGIITLFLHRRK